MPDHQIARPAVDEEIREHVHVRALHPGTHRPEPRLDGGIEPPGRQRRAQVHLIGLGEVGVEPVPIGRQQGDALLLARRRILRQRLGAIAAQMPRQHGRAMSPGGVVHIADRVVGGELPVALDIPAHHARRRDQIALVQQQVQPPAHVAQEFLERWRFRVESAEHQALVAVDPRHAHQAQRGLVDVILVQFRLARNADQVALGVVCPAVIRTDEAPGIAPIHRQTRLPRCLQELTSP